ncbi:MAG TPA: ATP-binding protein [bacterium]|nr:ATP-binding protein [bacterium]
MNGAAQPLKKDAATDIAPCEFKDLTVLLVDDEVNVLRSLKRVLRSEGYSIVSAESGEKGLEVLASHPVHLIVSDQRMPGMSGIEFLTRAKKNWPDAVRVMLTGYSDLRTAEDAINTVEIYRFLAKPWNDEDLKVTVKEGLRNWALKDYNRRLQARIEEQNQELWELNHDLELKVEERTRALKEAQARMLQSEKMASVGLLAGGVAHEINNPLAGILALCQVMLMEGKDGSIVNDLRQIEGAANQCKEIVSGLLSFSRQSDDRRREEVYPPAVVDKVKTLIGYRLREQNIEVEEEYDDDLPLIWAHPGQLQQVLMNLMMNAAQAMGKNGKIAVRGRARQDGGLDLEVEDHGTGIPDEIKAKIFDPFFTTKPEGEGTGLGLAVTYGIVKDHGGRIEVESVPGQGALFRVLLPPAPPREERLAK